MIQIERFTGNTNLTTEILITPLPQNPAGPSASDGRSSLSVVLLNPLDEFSHIQLDGPGREGREALLDSSQHLLSVLTDGKY